MIVDVLFNIEDVHFEIAIMAQFDHPNIIKLIGYSDNPLSIIMKHYSLSLLDLIKKKELNVQQIHQTILDIVSGMREIHRKDVVHLDLKPGT
jgi:serine/threonine protein kinase